MSNQANTGISMSGEYDIELRGRINSRNRGCREHVDCFSIIQTLLQKILPSPNFFPLHDSLNGIQSVSSGQV